MSADGPIPPAKRKNRRRKLSSSNESSTSEAASNSSDFVHVSGPLQYEQAGSLASLREGGKGGEDGMGSGCMRGEKMVRHDDTLHVTAPAYGSKFNSGGVGSHSLSSVHVTESDRGGKTSATASRLVAVLPWVV